MIIGITICLHFLQLPFMGLHQLLLVMYKFCDSFLVGLNDAAVCVWIVSLVTLFPALYNSDITHLSFAFILSFSVIRLTSASSRCSASLSFFSMSSERVLKDHILYYFSHIWDYYYLHFIFDFLLQFIHIVVLVCFFLRVQTDK